MPGNKVGRLPLARACSVPTRRGTTARGSPLTEPPVPPVDPALSWETLPLDDDLRRLLVALQRIVAVTPDADAIKQLLIELCQSVVCADGAVLEELDGDDLVVTHATGALVDALGVRLRRDHSIAGRAVATGEPQLSPDVTLDERADHTTGWSSGGRSLVVHPIQLDTDLPAAITVVHMEADALSARDAAILQPLVSIAASRLKHVTLFSQWESEARSDALTGLANRRAWLERLSLEMARALRTGSPLSLAVFDLDHFKAYNDKFGHQAGDVILQRTASAWQAQIRETDLLARLGGEEFALLLPDTTLEGGRLIGERLLTAVPEGITASCGLALWRGEDSTLLYRRADEALYAAKEAGRNRLAVASDHGS
jgi:diguanylate cyclase (GGDEF)-like protein